MGTEEAGDDAPSNADGTTYGYDPGLPFAAGPLPNTCWE